MDTTTQDRMFGELAGNVRRYREARGISQDQLARRAGVSRATVRKLEDGRYSHHLATMTKIANGLGVDVKALLG